MIGMWGATLRDYLQLRPVYLAYWEMLADAANSGFSVLDMGRSRSTPICRSSKVGWRFGRTRLSTSAGAGQTGIGRKYGDTSQPRAVYFRPCAIYGPNTVCRCPICRAKTAQTCNTVCLKCELWIDCEQYLIGRIGRAISWRWL